MMNADPESKPRTSAMRVPAAFVLTIATALAPVSGGADPAQPATVTAAPPAHVGETVTVNGRVESNDILDRLVCRAGPPPTGSRLGTSRDCYTVRQWNDRQKQSQSILENIQIRGLSLGYH
jgi:hypothetical protein